jgi:hypothetical protein
VLFVLATLLAVRGSWQESVLIWGFWSIYILAIRLVRCRVETLKHEPCRWRVRGLLGTCDYHVGDKRGIPQLFFPGNLQLPIFMWPRFNLPVAERAEPQPAALATGNATVAGRARKPSLDTLTIFLGTASLLVAIASFVRDLIAG